MLVLKFYRVHKRRKQVFSKPELVCQTGLWQDFQASFEQVWTISPVQALDKRFSYAEEVKRKAQNQMDPAWVHFFLDFLGQLDQK